MDNGSCKWSCKWICLRPKGSRVEKMPVSPTLAFVSSQLVPLDLTFRVVPVPAIAQSSCSYFSAAQHTYIHDSTYHTASTQHTITQNVHNPPLTPITESTPDTLFPLIKPCNRSTEQNPPSRPCDMSLLNAIHPPLLNPGLAIGPLSLRTPHPPPTPTDRPFFSEHYRPGGSPLFALHHIVPRARTCPKLGQHQQGCERGELRGRWEQVAARCWQSGGAGESFREVDGGYSESS